MHSEKKLFQPMWTKTIFVFLFLFCFVIPTAFAGETNTKPVIIGFDAEAGHVTSTSDDAIRMGILAAIHEINNAGGVLGGRPLELLVKDNRSVPARGVQNIEEFAEVPDLVAVVAGKFSPVVLEEVAIIHEKKILLLDAWAAADTIIDNGQSPNFCFRLSLKDSWAAEAMLGYAAQKGLKKLAVLLPTTGWGRSNEKAIKNYVSSHPQLTITTIQWFMWGDKSLIDKYESSLKSGAEAILFVTNEAEGAILAREVAALPMEKRLPIISHWGITGGNFAKMAGEALKQIDLSVVQTYSFFDNRRENKLKQFYQTTSLLFNISKPEDVPSPVGMAHAYDLTHILAVAINKAGSTDRSAIRVALEQIQNYDGLIKNYPQPFTAERHEALETGDLFMARYLENGHLLRVKE
jgi:branched-chain amino acid transport system substrate-binding protein